MDSYEPPVHVQVVLPMTFDAVEAQRRREAYEEFRRERARLWHQHEAEHNENYYQRTY